MHAELSDSIFLHVVGRDELVDVGFAANVVHKLPKPLTRLFPFDSFRIFVFVG